MPTDSVSGDELRPAARLQAAGRVQSDPGTAGGAAARPLEAAAN